MAVSPALEKPAAKAPLAVRYVAPQDLPGLLGTSNEILGIVDYGGVSGLTDDCCLPLVSVKLPVLGETPLVEVWTSSTPVVSGRQQGIHFARNDAVMFGAIEIRNSDQIWLDRDTHHAVSRMLSFIRNQGYPHLLRIWNYLPGINARDNEIERYQLFCLGRHQAFFEHGSHSRGELPAASALGTQAGSLWIYFITAAQPGIQRENPRQLSAYHYPRQYGPRSPSFARAILARWEGERHLYISGTASIIGHLSVHVGDVRQQLEEILANIKALIAHTAVEEGARISVEDLKLIKVYVRQDKDFAVVKEILEAGLGKTASVIYLQADICRSELLVEIEGVCVAPVS